MFKIYRITLFLSFTLFMLGILCKFQHWPGGNSLMAIALTLSLVYIGIALFKVFKSQQPILKKFLWAIGLILFFWITGFIYYFMVIKKQNSDFNLES